MTQFDLFTSPKEEAFNEYIHTPYGGELMNKFIRYSLQMKKRGFNHYSARTIISYMRFHFHFKHGPDNQDLFKINNNWTPYMARYAMKNVPELAGFFEVRVIEKKGWAA